MPISDIDHTTRHLTVKIRRYDPEHDAQPRWQEFKIDADPMDRVLDVLLAIKWNQDETLGLRRSCATASAARTRCGSTAPTPWRARRWSGRSRATP